MKKIFTQTVAVLFLFCFAMKSNAQWNLAGNNNASASSILGTTNSVPLGLYTKNTQRLIIDTLGRIGIGTTLPINILTVKGAGSTPAPTWVAAGAPLFVGFGENAVGNADYILAMASTSNNGRPVFVGRRSRGTLAAPTAMVNNDFIMSMLASAHDGTAFQNPATIDFFVDGTPTTGNVPARISFVTGSNSSNRAERLKIGNTGDITFNTNQFFLQKTTGNVGIGTLTPAAKLEVAGQVKITGGSPGSGKVLTSDGTGLASWSSNGLLPSGNASQTLVNNGSTWLASSMITNTGTTVGIGETSPKGVFHVSDPFNFAGIVFTGTGSNDLNSDISNYSGPDTTKYVIRIQNSGPNPNVIEISNDGGQTFGAPVPIANPITLANGVTATFDSTGGHNFGAQWAWSVGNSYNNVLVAQKGKVGIGTTTPQANLDVVGSVRALSGKTTSNAIFNLGRTATEATIGVAAGADSLITGAVAGDVVLRSENSNKVYINPGKNTLGIAVTSFGTGIGVANPLYQLDVLHEGNTGLHVKSSASFSAIDNDGFSGDAAIRFYKAGVSQWNIRNRPADNYLEFFELGGGGSRMVIQDATGFVGIGTTPTALLSVNGTANKPGGGSWTVFSDARLKDNVIEYKEGLEQLLKINPVKYHYNIESGYDTKPEYIGVIAQEIQKVAPYMVSEFFKSINDVKPLQEDKNSSTGFASPNTKDKKTYLQVDNSAMTYMLVNAVKELKTQVDTKDTKNSILEQAVNELQKQIDELKDALIKLVNQQKCVPTTGK